MSRWRDTKKGNVTPVKKKEKVKENTTLTNEKQISLSARMKAFLIDTFLINMPIIYFTIYVLMGGGAEFGQNMTMGWIIILSVNFIAVMLFWTIKGQTPGLKAYEGILVNTQTRKKISIIQAFVRYMMTLICILSIIGIFLPFLRKDKKSLQDLLSNTYAIEVDSQ